MLIQDALRSRPKALSALDHEDKIYETDLVIVGGGGAGLNGVTKGALQAGKKVIVVEKFPAVGGNTCSKRWSNERSRPCVWQNTFANNAGEAHTLQELHDLDNW